MAGSEHVLWLVETSDGAGGRGAERAVGERSEVAAARAPGAGAPDPELVKRPRRRFSAEYKLRILREADACSRPGEVGALLRRMNDPTTIPVLEYGKAELETAKRVIEVQGNVSALLGELLEPKGATESDER